MYHKNTKEIFVCLYPKKMTWWGWGFRYCTHIFGKHQTGLCKSKNLRKLLKTSSLTLKTSPIFPNPHHPWSRLVTSERLWVAAIALVNSWPLIIPFFLRHVLRQSAVPRTKRWKLHSWHEFYTHQARESNHGGAEKLQLLMFFFNVANPFNTSGKLRSFHTLAGLEALQGLGLGHFKPIAVAAGVDGGSASKSKSGVPPTLPLERNVACQSHAFASIKCCQA